MRRTHARDAIRERALVHRQALLEATLPREQRAEVVAQGRHRERVGRVERRADLQRPLHLLACAGIVALVLQHLRRDLVQPRVQGARRQLQAIEQRLRVA
ncbi:MAG: hypothetical protein U0168_27635 [Nannocystaceae bacterium]